MASPYHKVWVSLASAPWDGSGSAILWWYVKLHLRQWLD